MANLDNPRGFKVCRHLTGGTPARMNAYKILNGLDEAIYKGAAVNSDGSGGIKEAAANEVILGVFAGVQWVDAEGEVQFRQWWKSTDNSLVDVTDMVALVYDDPMLTFAGQCSGSKVAAALGLVSDISVPSPSGDSATGESRMEVGADDGSETQLKVLRFIYETQRNSTGGYQLSAEGTNAMVEFKVVRHELGAFAAIVEVA